MLFPSLGESCLGILLDDTKVVVFLLGLLILREGNGDVDDGELCRRSRKDRSTAAKRAHVLLKRASFFIPSDGLLETAHGVFFRLERLLLLGESLCVRQSFL